MQDKDRLEEFIRREVNQIEFDDADSMWQDFQGRLETEAPPSKSKFWYWLGLSSLLILIIAGSFFLGRISQQEDTNEVQTERITPAGQENHLSTAPTTPSPTEEEYDLSQSSSSNTNQIDSDEATIQSRQIEEQSTGFGNSRENNPSAAETHSSKLPEQESKQAAGMNSTQELLASSTPVGVDTLQAQDELEQELLVESTLEKSIIAEQLESVDMESADQEESPALLGPIAMIETKVFRPDALTETLPDISVESLEKAKRTRIYFVSIENSYARNEMRQHGLGVGTLFRLKNNFGISLQAGGNVNVRNSFSQDSVLITIEPFRVSEFRLQKDLRYLWNTYLSLGTFYEKGNWRFGLGLRASYALSNEFHISRGTLTYNTLGGPSSVSVEGPHIGVTGFEKGDWTGMNRLGLDASLSVNYQLARYSIGLFAERRLNPLIQAGKATRAYSNTPMEIGVVINRNF